MDSIKSSVVRSAIWIPVLIIALLMSPLVFTSRNFGADWTLHLWAVREQQLNIEALHHPALFLSANGLGAFYPVFAFVGSGMYSLGGYLAVLLGDRPIVAYKLLNLLGLCLAYGGMTWLSLQIGLRGWRSQIAGATFVTGTYYVTDMLGRGDFGEFIALSSIPFLIAAICAMFTTERVGKRHLLAVVFAFFVFTGSHNITLLFGSIFIALIAIVALAAFGSSIVRELSWRRTWPLLVAAAIGGGLNAWYLLPDVMYGTHTFVGMQTRDIVPKGFGNPGQLLNPFRPAYSTSAYQQDLRLSLPWMAFVWAIAVAVVTWRRSSRAMTRLVVGVVVLTAVYLVLSVSRRPWRSMPHVLYNIQFTFRVHGYVLLATALLVIVALKLHGTSRGTAGRVTMIGLLVIVAFNASAATWQAWRVRSEIVTYSNGTEQPRSTGAGFLATVVDARHEKPLSWYSPPSYFVDFVGPRVVYEPTRFLTIPVESVHGTKFVGTVDVPDGRAPFGTNIAASPHFVHMTGIRTIGRTIEGFAVAVRAPGTPDAGPIRVTIGPAHTALLRLGAAASVVSLIALLGLAVLPPRRVRQFLTRPADQAG